MIKKKFLTILCIILNLLSITLELYVDLPKFTTVKRYDSICYMPPGIIIFIQIFVLFKLFILIFKKNFLDSSICKNTNNDVNSNNIKQTEKYNENYFFDSISGGCYPFATQNCGGNENRFKTKEECIKKCKDKNEYINKT